MRMAEEASRNFSFSSIPPLWTPTISEGIKYHLKLLLPDYGTKIQNTDTNGGLDWWNNSSCVVGCLGILVVIEARGGI